MKSQGYLVYRILKLTWKQRRRDIALTTILAKIPERGQILSSKQVATCHARGSADRRTGDMKSSLTWFFVWLDCISLFWGTLSTHISCGTYNLGPSSQTLSQLLVEPGCKCLILFNSIILFIICTLLVSLNPMVWEEDDWIECTVLSTIEF